MKYLIIAALLIEAYDMVGKLKVEKNILDQPEWLNLTALKPGTYIFVLKNKQGGIVGVKMQEVQ